MTQEQIKELALKAYPERIFLFGEDVNKEKRKYLIEALKKASELLYSEEQMKDAFDKGEKYGREDMQYAVGRLLEVTALNKDEFIQSLKQQ